MSDLLITNVDVLTNEGVLKNHAIEIENGFITAIVKNSEVEKAKESAKDVLDGKANWLLQVLLIHIRTLQWVYLETMQMILSSWTG